MFPLPPARTLLCLLVLLCSVAGGQVWAQQAPMAPGNRVRVWTGADAKGKSSGKPTVGILTAWTADSVLLNTGKVGVVSVPESLVTRFERSNGRRPRRRGALRGAGYGLLAGAATGGLLGLASGDDTSGFFRLTAGEKAAMGGIMLGLPGALIGAVVGANRPGERWERVSLPVRVGVTPPGRTGLVLTASFSF